ncbi:MoaD/ThiS family protein [Pseudomonas vanderleydeniana]|uniref:Molybdopterin synthase sulfur carrier subunit n=1 Tax=Pseudomonas vanderleydeniana TaxID=2745495 RepID=A0A9E6PJ65_9PSED|nr:MoaD/ThiS family protein [Pseudomonas vanderleydeniana]QXI27591.1 MoaD/ThiS family protein [Pseudomonas vanderleydeniana]
MKLDVQFFARYREVLGVDAEQIEGDFATIEQLRGHLLQRGGDWQVLAEHGLMCARNQELCAVGELLADGDEVAFFPTVTGG